MSRCHHRLVFLSKSLDPFFNLAFENWLIQDHLRHHHDPECLFLYRNSSAIIVGRNQNVWAECNVPLAKKLEIPIIRRYSGGGAVFHDSGNVNYSLHRSKSDFDRSFAAQMVIKALAKSPAQPNLSLSPRHDIFIKRSPEESAKVSGSAYKLTRERSYHHGTMLLNSDLTTLSGLLSSDLDVMKDDANYKFGGVSSVKSMVANVEGVDFDEFVQLVSQEFIANPEIRPISEEASSSKILEYMEELKGWQWTFGKSPPFQVKLKDLIVAVEEGKVASVSDPQFSHLIGNPFESNKY